MLKRGINKFLLKKQFYRLNLLNDQMSQMLNESINYQQIEKLVKENQKDLEDPINMDLVLKRVINLENFDKVENEKFNPLISNLVSMSRKFKPQNRLLFYKFLSDKNFKDKNLWVDVFSDLKKLSKNILKSDNMEIIINIYSFVIKNEISVEKIDYVFTKLLKEIEKNENYLEKINFSQSISLLNGFDLYFKKNKKTNKNLLNYLINKSKTNFKDELKIENENLNQIIFNNENGYDLLRNFVFEIVENYKDIHDIDKDLIKTVN